MKLDQDEYVRLIEEAIGCAIEGNAEGASRALDKIGETADNHLMYGVCCAIATAGTHALRKLYGKQAPDPSRGDMWAFQELSPGALAADPAKAFAARFLVAYSNDDTDTCLALFSAALKAGSIQFVDSVCALLADVAGILRLLIAEKDAGRFPNGDGR